MTATNWPNPVDILDINPGTLTLLFPNNRSFVHLKPATEAATVGAPGMSGMPMPPAGLPWGLARNQPRHPMWGHATSAPAHAVAIRRASHAYDASPTGYAEYASTPTGGWPASTVGNAFDATNADARPTRGGTIMPNTKPELQATGPENQPPRVHLPAISTQAARGDLGNLGHRRVAPLPALLQNQPHRFGPRRDQGAVAGDARPAASCFQLLVSLRYDKGAERFRFEVQSVTPRNSRKRGQTISAARGLV